MSKLTKKFVNNYFRLLRAELEMSHEAYVLGAWVAEKRYSRWEVLKGLYTAAKWLGFDTRHAYGMVASALDAGIRRANYDRGYERNA